MSIRRSKSNKKKDPIGTAVFYPNSLPPPPRQSPRSSEVSRSSASTAPREDYSPAIPVRGSSLQPLDQAIPPGPFENATDYCFPKQSPSHSPSQLTTMLENWSVFTPSPQSSMDRFPGLYSHDSAADLSILSPNALPLSDLIEESLYQDESSPSDLRRRIASPYAKPALHIDSPAPRAGLFTTSPLPPRANPNRGQSAFFLGSPQPLPPSPLTRPIPFRQPSWLTAAAPRRVSEPNVSIRMPAMPASPFASPLYLPPSPLRSNSSSVDFVPESTTDQHLPSYGALPIQPGLGDIFSPAPVLEASNPSGNQYSFPATFGENTLHLQFNEPFGAAALPHGHIQHQLHLDQYQHKHEATYVSVSEDSFRSEVAAEALYSRILDAEFVKRYEIRDELGHGGFGFVCSAVQTGYQNQPGVEVAVKFIYKNRIKEWDQAVMHGEPVESYVLSRCRHPNIIAYVSLFEDTEFWYLIQELHGDPWAPDHTLVSRSHIHASASVPGMPVHDLGLPSLSPISAYSISPPSDRSGWSPKGRPNMARRASHDLFEAIEHQRFNEDQARIIFRQIVDAVSYMHKRGIYHRDLKDENIVIDRNLCVKIIDFGSAVIEDRHRPAVVHDQFRGTMSYASAEVLKGSTYHAGPADIWALGIILGVILTGESPFPDSTYARNGRIKIKRNVPAEAYDLMARCLHTNPKRRATVETLERHKWLSRPHRGSV